MKSPERGYLSGHNVSGKLTTVSFVRVQGYKKLKMPMDYALVQTNSPRLSSLGGACEEDTVRVGQSHVPKEGIRLHLVAGLRGLIKVKNLRGQELCVHLG